MSASLLRPEAVLARLQGQPCLPLLRPRLVWLVISVIAFLVASGVMATKATYSSSVRVQGELLADAAPVPLHASTRGRVVEVAVAEGATVAAGDLLLTLAEARFATGREVATEVAALQDQRSYALEREQAELQAEFTKRNAALTARRQESVNAAARAARATFLARRRAALSANELERLRPLRQDGYIAAHAWEERESAHLARVLEADRAAADEERASLEIADMDAARVALAGEFRSRRAALTDALLVIAAERMQSGAIARSEVRAPINGRVTALRVAPGHPVAAGSALLTLLPPGPVNRARLYVPESAAAAAKPGARVWLQVPALGDGDQSPLPARVRELGAAAVATRRDGRVLATPALPLVAELEAPAPAGLLPGMSVTAQLLEEQRTLLDWLVKPFEDIRRRLAGEP